ncbi:MAG: ECF transporter S component [Firmicutes bacterium]|nr:ECF transporter S component [Bacillota bacterium]
MQLTPYAYSLVIFGIILVFILEQLLDTTAEYEAEQYILKVETEDPGISKRTIIGLILVVVAIPLVIAFGVLFLQDRSIYFTSLSVMILSMVPFFLVFENRRPEAREIIVIAVMAALAAVGRAAFFMLPFFKPVAAIVIISGVALGSEAGFLTGAMAALVSNFLFGQGPWTPWQMFSFGIIGFIAGLIFRKYRHGKTPNIKLMAVYGFLSTFLIYGPIMDTSTVTQAVSMGFQDIDWEAALAIYAAGIPVNLVHATSSLIFILILARPILKKLTRVKQKYGILEP